MAWSIGEKIGTMLLQAGVSFVVLMLLLPDDFGVMAILTSLVTFAQVFVDSGFSQTLIRSKNEPSAEDYSSVFVFNITVSLLLYGALVALSPWVADYYAMPEIRKIAPVFFLFLPVNALCVIQNTLLIRQFRFALLSKVTFAASVVSGAAAILMAVAGYGVWSLVAQRLAQVLTRAVMLWWLGEWRPRAVCSSQRLRSMAPYSLSLMTTDLITAVYNKVPQLFIGKIYSADTLGYYDQAQKLKDLPVTSTMTAVQGVIFPALSKIADQEQKFAESFRQIVMVVSYVMFPVMLGLSAVGYEVFDVFLKEKWMPTVPYFEIICLSGLFYPIAMVAYNIMKVKCSGKRIVQLEVLKKVMLTAILVVVIPQSITAVMWGLVAFAVCEMVVNVAAALRVTQLSLWRFVRTLLPIAAVSLTMYLIVQGVGSWVASDSAVRLIVELAVGVVSYLLLSVAFRLEAFREVVTIIGNQLKR